MKEYGRIAIFFVRWFFEYNDHCMFVNDYVSSKKFEVLMMLC